MGKVWLFQGDCLDVLRTLPSESVHACVTSPPYYGLRDYGTASWEGGSSECDHVQLSELRQAASGSSRLGYPSDGGPRPISDNNQYFASAKRMQYRGICGKCGAVRVDHQIGLEQTLSDYVDKLVNVCREVRRVLRNDGTMWLNLGDSFTSGPTRTTGRGDNGTGCPSSRLGPKRDGLLNNQEMGPRTKVLVSSALSSKNLQGIPWKVAFALQDDGWILRSDIVWQKPNVLPESVRDRPTRCHEYLFLLTKDKRYYYDMDAIREPHTTPLRASGPNALRGQVALRPRGQAETLAEQSYHPGGRNKRSVWTIATKSYKGAHFAVFPDTLVEPCLFAGTSEHGCCQECGTPYRRIVEKGEPDAEWQKQCGADTAGEYHGQATKDYASAGAQNASATKARILAGMRERKTVGWQKQCGCDTDEVSPCTVLDPFAGSGTTGEVAVKHGRNAVLIELNPSYCELIKDRVGRENVST